MPNEIIRCSSCFAVKQDNGPCPKCGADESARNAAHQLQIGTVLKEQYRIGKVLGQGGFGITYLGWDLYLDIPVAIKEYYPNGMVTREATVTMNVTDVNSDEGERFRSNRDRFMREAKMLARFSQVREVVQVKSFFLENNTAYIVMEYVEGITLKQYVANAGGKLSAQKTFEILGPMIQTLAKVHKTGIVHRDINPANIMMVDGGAKLLDFGAVRVVSDAAVDQELSRSTEAILTQGYAPIEQYQKRGSLGPWTDVYAMCATIYFCLTGQVPADAPARLLLDEEIDFGSLPQLTAQQQKALTHGMELRTDRRICSMEQLYKELFEVAAPPPPPPPPAPPAPPAPPKPEKPRKKARFSWKKLFLSALLTVILCLAALAAIGWSVPDDTSPDSDLMDKNMVSGMCGDAARWYLDPDTGVLKIDGVHMYDFYLEEYSDAERQGKHPRPWEDYKDQITEVVLDNNLHRLGSASFADCPNLKKVSFGVHLKEIGTHAFRGSGLEQINLPTSLEVIEHCAFEGTQLREVSLPIFITYLGHEAFSNCPNLETVEILGCVRMNFDTWTERPIFSRDSSQVDGITLWAPPGGNIQEYARIFDYSFEPMGSGVIYEAQGDFSEFPGNVKGNWYFDKESGFLKIEGEMPVAMKGQWEVERNEVAPERKNLPLAPWFDYRGDILTVSIGEGVTRISENAFSWCNSLTDIHLPSTLKSIGFQSFLATNIDEIIIPDSVTDISEFAFNYCGNLHTVKLPADLVALDSSVFNCCFALERVYMGEWTQPKSVWMDGQQVTPFNSCTDHDTEVNENLMPEKLTLVIPPQSQPDRISPAVEFSTKFGVAFEEGVFRP